MEIFDGFVFGYFCMHGWFYELVLSHGIVVGFCGALPLLLLVVLMQHRLDLQGASLPI